MRCAYLRAKTWFMPAAGQIYFDFGVLIVPAGLLGTSFMPAAGLCAAKCADGQVFLVIWNELLGWGHLLMPAAG